MTETIDQNGQEQEQESLEVQEQSQELSNQEPETLAQETEAAGQEEDAAMEAQDQQFDVPEIHAGDTLVGKIVQVNPDHLLVDVGYKADGMVPSTETGLSNNEDLAEHYKAGDEISVQVLSVDHQGDGGLILSLRRAQEEAAWEKLTEAEASQEILTANVSEAVKGGLVVDVGVRAFMPASHIERGYVNDLNVYVGQPIRFRVIELDKSKNRIILSQKVVLEEEYRELREKTWAELEEGQVRKGVVKGITDFGAFVDLGGVDGLLHVSEMAWERVNHPSEVLQIGDEINVKILALDTEKEKISLGLKQTLPDPWDTAAQNYPEGSIITGKVMRLAPFGAFVQLEPGIEGLVHISQMANRHVAEPSEVVQEGEEVRVRVLRVQPQERRISLSIKAADETAGGGQSERSDSGSRKGRAPRSNDQGGHAATDNSSQGSGVTLGDMFGDLLEEMKGKLNE